MKQSKNTGVTKSCPQCKKTLLKEINLEGTGTLKTKCPHCKELVLVEVGKKTSIKVVKVAVAILVIVTLVNALYTVQSNRIITMCS